MASSGHPSRPSRLAAPARPGRARTAPRRGLGFSFAFALALAAHPAGARDDRPHDHDQARAARAAGEVLPLQQLLAQLSPRYPGEVLDVELEREDGAWRYEIKLIQTDGTLLKLEVDAKTGAVLKSRRRAGPRPDGGAGTGAPP